MSGYQSTKTLKRCPRCGQTKAHVLRDDNEKLWKFSIICGYCWLRTKPFTDEDLAIDNWNQMSKRRWEIGNVVKGGFRD